MYWLRRLWQNVRRPRVPLDEYPTDWNRFYRDGKLVSATPPTATFRGCRFDDCEVRELGHE